MPFIPTPLRSKKNYENYQKNKKKGIKHLEVVEEFPYWNILKNEFPYDKIASRHDLLVSRREGARIGNITLEEWKELTYLLDTIELNEAYDCIMLSFSHSQTYPQDLHFHLLKIKEEQG